jgi:hypothetical protein
MEAMTVSTRIQQTDMHDFFCLRVRLRLMLQQLQVSRQIKVLPFSCVCAQLNIVD